MKRVLAFALSGIFFASLAMAQDQKLLKEFTRTDYFSNAKLSFVLLTDTTIDMFFKGTSKDAVKAKADAGTAFYVLGTAEKNTKLDTKFIVIQDEEKTTSTIMNIKNFADGEIAKGEKISGIIQFDKKLNLMKAFTIKNANGLVDFKLSDIVLRTLPN